MSTVSPQLFISYRREDTAGHAGRLYDAMVARFGEPHVFVDVDLAPGIEAGFLAGLAVGAVVRLGWNAVDWSPDSAFEEAFAIGVQCLFIVGLTLVALQLLSGQRKLATA